MFGFIDRLFDWFGRKMIAWWTGLPEDVVSYAVNFNRREREELRKELIERAREMAKEESSDKRD